MNGTCCCVELTVTEDAEVLLSVAEDSQVGLDVEEQFVDGGGGITPTGTKTINVTENGTTTTDVTYYANAKVVTNVPNTYAAADEGKVVQDGDLEAQTTATFQANDTYDTTTIKQVTVDVPASAVDSGYVYINENDTHDVTGYAQAVVNVPASAVDSGTKSISVTANGTTTHDVVGYASASVTANVPNTYAAGDEGKVVDDGELVSQGSATYTINSTYDTTKIKSVTVNVSGGGSPTLQTKSVSYTPSESQQTAQVTADEGYDALQEVDVTVGAVSSTYVGSGITRRDDTDLSASGATVSVPSGYYEDSETYTVSSGSAATPATTVTANPSISVNSSTGVITATASATKSVTPTVSAGYVSSGTAGTITVSGSNTSALSTQSGTTITPTTSEQTAVAAGKYTTGAVKVAAMPSGTAGTPTATKGTVSSHSVSVTPSVTNSAGYISSGTLTGTAVTVTAAELESGTKTITSNGTNIDVTGYAAVDVNVSGGGGTSLVAIASGTATATGANDLPISVGKKLPQTDFWVKIKAQASSNFANDANYKHAYIFGVINSDMGYFDLSTVGDSKQITSTLSFNVAGSAKTSGTFIAQMTTVRNATANTYGRPNNFRINRKSDHFEVRIYNSNSSYIFPNGIVYDWEVVYFGNNASTDIIEIT